MHFVLASASPRRRELMELLGVRPLKILPAVGEENAAPGLTGGALAEFLALHKAREVAQQCDPDDIVIGAEYVSGRHARFSIMGQNLFVEDLKSTNGTAVNGHRIVDPVALKSGDVVSVGDIDIRVRFD